MAFIEYNNILLKFNERVIFDDFSLSIEKGERILLSASSGSGKTTLVKMLMGFIVPDAGEVIVAGQKINGKSVNEIRSKIAYTSQDADLPKGIVSEVFEEVFNFSHNRHLNYKQEMLENWLPKFSLPKETVNKEVDDLSGGERQRLAIIMGLLLKREIWILDEVTTGLDLGLKETVVECLLSFEQTMLIVSHDEIYQNRSLREVTW